MSAKHVARHNSFDKYNRILSAINVLIALYIFITPLLPNILFYLRDRFGAKPVIYSSEAVGQPEREFPEGKTLLIPSIHLEEKIHEGPTTATLSQGVWRWPDGSTPDINNNTVLAGHLFTYTSPAVFYNLEKVKTGDQIAVYWNDKEYLYEVTDRRIVLPQDTEVLGPTNEARLTIYTCTPLWNPTHRFVLISKLVEVNAP